MPFGISDPRDSSGGSRELANVQSQLGETRARLKQYHAWVNDRGALQRLRQEAYNDMPQQELRPFATKLQDVWKTFFAKQFL
jgi:hypothetical protein